MGQPRELPVRPAALDLRPQSQRPRWIYSTVGALRVIDGGILCGSLSFPPWESGRFGMRMRARPSITT